MQSSKILATDAKTDAAILGACSAAADELSRTRVLVSALESENAAVKARLESEQKIASVVEQIATSRAAESAALRAAVKAKDETIAAKDALVANRNALIETLRKKPRSPLKRIGDILIGAAIFAIFK